MSEANVPQEMIFAALAAYQECCPGDHLSQNTALHMLEAALTQLNMDWDPSYEERILDACHRAADRVSAMHPCGKPDPRTEKILDVLFQHSVSRPGKAAAEILAALDGKSA